MADKKTENSTEQNKKEREAMAYNGVPEYIREISCFKLSEAGQIKLSAFPEQAIEHAVKTMKTSGTKRDPFRWFFKVCNDYCTKSNSQPNWKLKRFLEETHGITDDMPMLLELPKPVASSSETSKTGEPTGPRPQWHGEKDPSEQMLMYKEAKRKEREEWQATKTPEERARLKAEWDFPMPILQSDPVETVVKITVAPPQPAPVQPKPTDDQWFDGTPINYDFVDDTVDGYY